MQFKDLFSKQSSEYAKYRPTYPKELFSYLAEIVREKKQAWDCGTGNGQAARELAVYFEHVFATDPSASQIQNAPAHPKIKYFISTAEHSTLPDASVDLITVAQAFHWFHQAQFLTEVQRVSKPGAVLAIWCYELAKINKKVDVVVNVLYEQILGSYWDPERKMVDEGYRNVKYPLKDIPAPHFEIKVDWTLEQLVGYLTTWSALQKYISKNHKNPIDEIFEDLKNAWGPVETQSVLWPLGLRIWQV